MFDEGRRHRVDYSVLLVAQQRTDTRPMGIRPEYPARLFWGVQTRRGGHRLLQP